jgi:hypothetical protein
VGLLGVTQQIKDSHSVRAGKMVAHLITDSFMGKKSAEKDRIQFQYYMTTSNKEKYWKDTYWDLVARQR